MVRRVALYHRVSRAFILAGSLGYRHLALLYRGIREWYHGQINLFPMLEKIKAIFYRPDWFRRQEFTTGQALRFYSLSILLLVIGFSLFLIPVAWGVNQFFGSAEWAKQKAIIQALYPDDLVLTLRDGKLLTNQSEPVIIPFPEEWRENECQLDNCKKKDLPFNLLVIDSEAELSRKAIKTRDALILANETEIGFSNKRGGETRIFDLSEVQINKTIEIKSTTFRYWVDRGASIVQTAILFLIVVLPLLMFIGLWLGYIVYAFLGALVVWLAAHIRKHRLTYTQAYRSTLYLLPASFVVSFLMTVFGFRVPFLFTLVLFGMALANFHRQPKEPIPTGPFAEAKPRDNTIPPTPPRPV